jgi:hypothetical protein
MSRATMDAWYNGERIDRLKLVAAYFVLNGIILVAIVITGAVELFTSSEQHGASLPVFPIVISIAMAAVSFYCAYLLWNARKEGGYWVIALTLLGVLGGGISFGVIPLILVAMSWSALKSRDELVRLRLPK